MSIIRSIPKSAMTHVSDPLCYRDITLAVSIYNLFCGVMNDHLKTRAEDINLIFDEQNVLRTDRNCIDHIHSFVNIMESQMENNQSTVNLQLSSISTNHMTV